jgi:SNF2 family DNA or RNA helicase
MKHVLTWYQRKAARYARTRARIALFMEMRLGKSIVAIRWAQRRRRHRRVLLVAPLTTLLGQLNWEGELRREGIPVTLLSNVKKDRRLDLLRPSRLTAGRLVRRWARGWFAVNYEALRTQPELLAAPWDTIILDESTRIRTPQAQITKTLIRNTDHIDNRAILTGLPNPENPMDYFCQFQFLNGQFLGFNNFWIFRDKLFYQGFTDWDWQPKSGTRQRIKDYVHQHAFVMTRKQAKVGSAKVRLQRSVEMNTAQQRLIREIRRDFAVDGTETKWTTVLETWMQRIAGGFHPQTLECISDRKIRLAEELVMEEFRHEPVIIWFRFNEEIRYLQQWLRTRHRQFKVEHVHGKVKKEDRPKIQERFHNGETNLLLMQVKLGRYGWNLSRSSTSIYYSNTYEFEDRSQSEDRIIHLTKTDPCLYLDLVTIGTPDEDVVEALSRKRTTARFFNTAMREGLTRRINATHHP